MRIPLEITWRDDVQPDPAIERAVRRKALALDHYCDHLMACRVSIESPHRRHRQGQRYRVRIDLTVPGAELVVGHLPGDNPAYEDLRAALRDAFRAARRQLQEYARIRRGHTKSHEERTIPV
jgi:hypothetical protein